MFYLEILLSMLLASCPNNFLHFCSNFRTTKSTFYEMSHVAYQHILF